MPKGLFSQAFVILLREYVEPAGLRPLLTEFNVVKETPAQGGWYISGPGLLVEYKREINGLVAVDVVNQPWPDSMSDGPKHGEIFAAWALGFFGPFVWPGALEYAVQQSWQWPEAKMLVPEHTGFVRLRMSYSLGGGKDARCLPPNYDPLDELDFLGALASALLRHPAALCYFNPSGQLLLPKERLDQQLQFAREHDLPAMPAWTNVRLFDFDADWLVMDTVGNWQLDMPDHELAIPQRIFEDGAHDSWLRDVSLYFLRNPGAVKDGETMDQPGGQRWQGKTFRDGLVAPMRGVRRWLPLGTANIPKAFLEEKPPRQK